MAIMYDVHGQYDKSLEYYGKALTVYLATLGDNNPSIAATYHNMAVVYNAQGHHDKALEYHGKALGITLATLGDNNPSTAGTYNNIAAVYGAQGQQARQGAGILRQSPAHQAGRAGGQPPEHCNHLCWNWHKSDSAGNPTSGGYNECRQGCADI